MTPPRAQILDAYVLINLLASGEIEGVLRAAAEESLICSAVEGESIYLRTEDPKAPLEPIDLRPLIGAGLLTVCHIEGDEEAELHVDYASALDDGEAMSLAIALSRRFVLATDERKARRLFLEATGEPQRREREEREERTAREERAQKQKAAAVARQRRADEVDLELFDQ